MALSETIPVNIADQDPIWRPDLSDLQGPRYKAIADAIANDIKSGDLPPGTRLPTHRDLAWRLNVTVGTITRAYKEATARGLIDGEIGRGTFVRDQRIRGWGAGVDRDPGLIADFGPNYSPLAAETEVLFRQTLVQVASDPSIGDLSGYDQSGGRPAHREGMASWLRRLGASAAVDTTLVTSGVQHGVAISVTALFEAGDGIAMTRLTHPSAKMLALRRGLRIIPIEFDADGMTPEALDAACRISRPKGVFLVPSHDNPTTTVMPQRRREEIAAVCERYNLIVIEDDVYTGFVPEAPPPVASLIPEHTIYIASGSKHLGGGFRIGGLSAPEAWRKRLQPTLRDLNWMAPPVLVEVFLKWVADGLDLKLAADKREEMRARHEIAAEVLAGFERTTTPTGLNLWLKLPDLWAGRNANGTLLERGVAVTEGEVFETVPGAGRGYIRIALGRPTDRTSLENGLHILRETLMSEPDGIADVL